VNLTTNDGRHRHIGELTVSLNKSADGESVEQEGPARNLSEFGRSEPLRFERISELTDNEDSISNVQKAVHVTDDVHSIKQEHLASLASSQSIRLERIDQEIQDIEPYLADILEFFDGTPEKLDSLANFGGSRVPSSQRLTTLAREIEGRFSHFVKRTDEDEFSQLPPFQRINRMARDMEDQLSNMIQGAQFTDDGHLDKPEYLSNRGSSLFPFEGLDQMIREMGDSISKLRETIQFTDDGNTDNAEYLSLLGSPRLERLDRLIRVSEDYMNAHKSLQFTDDRDPVLPPHLCMLGRKQREDFERLGLPSDIDDSILNFQNAVLFTHDGHPSKASYLAELGISQLARFDNLSGLAELEDGILNLQRAVHLTDDGHPEKARYLSNLGCAQQSRFSRLGEVTDIDDSISNLRSAVQRTDDGHMDKPSYLSNLSSAQVDRFRRLGELTDLEDGISNIHRAVQLAEDSHPGKAIYLFNLGSTQRHRFTLLGQLTDIEDCLSNIHKAIQFTDDKDANKAPYLALLGSCQRVRFEHLGELTDLDKCISNLYRAVRLTSNGHPRIAEYLCDLGISYKVRFNCLGLQCDIEESISKIHEAIQLTDDGHPNKAAYICNLGFCQQLLFERLGQPAAREASISSFKATAQSKTADPHDALIAACEWAQLSYHSDDVPSALHGFRTALQISPRVAWPGLSTLSRQDSLLKAKSEELSCLAATCAIQQGRLEEAVELVDSGRSVFWQQASSLRVGLETLKEIEPELAAQLERVGHILDTGNFSEPLPIEEDGRVNSTEDVGKERHRLVGEWEGLLERVRQLPHYEHFLKPAPFHQLRRAAIGGHVIIINVSQYGVDALIFDDARQIVHVPLPNIDFETLSTLAQDIMHQQVISISATQRQRFNNRYLKPALRVVWNDILIPIFDHLQIPLNDSYGPPQHRIWWYPTGPLTFIPIHAARSSKGDIDVSRLVISSYMTTLGSLMQKKTGHGAMMGQLKLLALSQPVTPGQESLPLALDEVDKVVEVVSSAGWSDKNIVNLSGPDATVDRVSEALDSCAWVHFSCHGIQYQNSGINSAFVLQDGNLKLSQIASKKLSTSQFAFLSACHTAAGMNNLPGEVMHLAGGLQFIGFSSVIATMWGICDKDAPIVASHTYEYLFRNGLKGCDPSEAAAALNHAVLCLRKDPEVTVDRWAPFIHFGI